MRLIKKNRHTAHSSRGHGAWWRERVLGRLWQRPVPALPGSWPSKIDTINHIQWTALQAVDSEKAYVQCQRVEEMSAELLESYRRERMSPEACAPPAVFKSGFEPRGRAVSVRDVELKQPSGWHGFACSWRAPFA